MRLLSWLRNGFGRHVVPATKQTPPEFNPADALISEDPRTGDVIILARGAAASFVSGQWKPGNRFDPGITKNFDAVEDLGEMQKYLDAAREALLKSLEG